MEPRAGDPGPPGVEESAMPDVGVALTDGGGGEEPPVGVARWEVARARMGEWSGGVGGSGVLGVPDARLRGVERTSTLASCPERARTARPGARVASRASAGTRAHRATTASAASGQEARRRATCDARADPRQKPSSRCRSFAARGAGVAGRINRMQGMGWQGRRCVPVPVRAHPC